MPRLIEIAAELRHLFDSADADGEISPDILQHIDTLGLSFDAKVDGCCGLIAEWEVEAAGRKGSIAGLQALIDQHRAALQTRENKVKGMKTYLIECLRLANLKRHETGKNRIRRQNNAPRAVCVVDPVTLPAELVKPPPPPPPIPEPNCDAALKAWKDSGEERVPDGFEIKQGEHLRIE